MKTGSKVICINNIFPPWVRDSYDQLPVKDRIYTVRALEIGRDGASQVSGGKATGRLLLEELKNPPDYSHKDREELGFNMNRFREVEELDETFTTKNKQEESIFTTV